MRSVPLAVHLWELIGIGVGAVFVLLLILLSLLCLLTSHRRRRGVPVATSVLHLTTTADEGGDPILFAELLMSSGVVLNADWITFHGGYDFRDLLRLLTGRNLPDTMPAFFDLIRIYFPALYDIKHLMKFCSNLHGGLSKLGELLGVKRVGISHQAGSLGGWGEQTIIF
uniref:Uncharacterized protein n=1 Tax=Leersia perrieri TaxID=77586 RepID=A0A0D9VQ82_9ORYZ